MFIAVPLLVALLVATASVGNADRAGETAASPQKERLAASTSKRGTRNRSVHRSASFERSLNGGSDFGWTTDSPFGVTRTNAFGGADGAYAARIATNGGNETCSCARITFADVGRYGPGDEVWISGSCFIPDGSDVSWSRLMNLGDFEGSDSAANWYLGLESAEPGTIQVGYAPYGDPHVELFPPRPIPTDRWFSVKLHLVLSPRDGRALTEWRMDGRLVGTSRQANMLSREPLTFYNAGLSYFWPGNGDATVYFDDARLRSS